MKSWAWVIIGILIIGNLFLIFYDFSPTGEVISELDYSVVKIKPTQCADFSWSSIEEAKNYFESRGIEIYGHFKVVEDIAVCEACHCPSYDLFFFLIKKEDLFFALENNLSVSECRGDFSKDMCLSSGGIYNLNGQCNC